MPRPIMLRSVGLSPPLTKATLEALVVLRQRAWWADEVDLFTTAQRARGAQSGSRWSKTQTNASFLATMRARTQSLDGEVYDSLARGRKTMEPLLGAPCRRHGAARHWCPHRHVGSGGRIQTHSNLVAGFEQQSFRQRSTLLRDEPQPCFEEH